MTHWGIDVMIQVGLRTWRQILRRPAALVFSWVLPLVWMLLFGALFHRFPLEAPYSAANYTSFLAPGVCAMAVLFGASQSGVSLIRDRQNRFLLRLLNTPSPPTLILGGKIVADSLALLLPASAVLLMAWLLGASLNLSPAAFIVSLAALWLFGCAFASVSCWIAVQARNPETLGMLVQLACFPILLASTALAPAEQMPGWLENIARWNPLTFIVDALRQALILGETPAPLPLLFPLALGGALCFLLAAGALRRPAL